MINSNNFNLMSSNISLSLSKEMQIPYFLLMRLIGTAPHRYKCYTIPKRSDPNKVRHIAQPAREIKSLQRWVTQEVLSNFPVHSVAHAYENNSSIRKNAEQHAKNRYLLKMDFKDFFSSIIPDDFLAIASKKTEINEHDLYFLKQILFYKNIDSNKLVLSIGAPSSPKISNIVMYDFDEKLTSYCRERNIVYTRYADDLAFSTEKENILINCEKFISELCDTMESPRLCINEQKTVHSSKKRMRRVTGLILTNDGNVSLGRDRKRLIKAVLHNYKCGKIQNKNELNKLRGWLAFAKDAEPCFWERLNNKYSKEIKFLMKMSF